MEVEVLFFAVLRERAGTGHVVRPLAAGDTVASLVARLTEEFPGLPPLGPSLRPAVNEAFVSADHRLSSGDVVALLPPVSGG